MRAKYLITEKCIMEIIYATLKFIYRFGKYISLIKISTKVILSIEYILLNLRL